MNPTSTRLQAAAMAASALLVGVFAVPAVAGTMQTNQHDFIHKTMGKETPEARSVGQITVGWDVDGANLVRGSGVLVGGRYVLTAAHLIDDARGGVFTINGQNYNMASWVVANQFYRRDTDDVPNPETRVFGNGADLALVLLDRRVGNARNLKARISKSRKEGGKTATIVGHGRGGNGAWGTNSGGVFGTAPTLIAPLPGDGSMDAGGESWNYQPIIRAGKNKIETNGPFGSLTKSNRELVTDFDPSPDLLEPLRLGLVEGAVKQFDVPSYDPFTGTYNLDEDDIPISSEYAPAIGDSGGGLFINGRLAGITSWTSRGNSEFFSQAYYSRLSVGWWKWVRDNIKAYNHARRFGLTERPWNKVSNGGNGFRGVAKILSETQYEVDGTVVYWKGQVINIFGPHLFYDETDAHIDVGSDMGGNFIANDLGAFPAPLPEPTSLALLGLGGFAMLRRTRR